MSLPLFIFCQTRVGFNSFSMGGISSKGKRNMIAAGIVVALALLLALANKWNSDRKNGLSSQVADRVSALVTKAVQFNGQAAQDSNPMFGLIHSNYGLAYLTVARQLANDEQVRLLTRYDASSLERELTGRMQTSMVRLAEACTSVGQAPVPIASPSTTRPSVRLSAPSVPLPQGYSW
jgi:hypothetical protein